MPIKLGELELLHEFVEVENLVDNTILGVDFCTEMGWYTRTMSWCAVQTLASPLQSLSRYLVCTDSPPVPSRTQIAG